MSQPDVFVPQDGPLLLRGNIATGMPVTADAFRKNPSRSGSRSRSGLSSQSGYRFGQLSHNSFFARHNPHPGRVRHIKGLLDVPICAVNDDGYLSNPRYSMQFPPNTHDSGKLQSYSKYFNMPANAINVNNQKHPINTITGLQYFLGKPLNMRVFREKNAPRPGIGQVHEAWQDELSALTAAVGLNGRPQPPPQHQPQTGRPKTQYSETTGRILPPPSRAMSRGGSRGPTASQMAMMTLGQEDEGEGMVMNLLCQILQTEDMNSVQQWLVSAGDREKSLVMDMIKSAVTSSEEYYKQYPNEMQNEKSKTAQSIMETGRAPLPVPEEGEILGGGDLNGQVDRLSLDPATPGPRPTSQLGRPSSQLHQVPEENDVTRYTFSPPKPIMKMTNGIQSNGVADEEYARRPVTSDAFRPSRHGDRPNSRLQRAKTPSKPKTPQIPTTASEPRLRYITTPASERNIRHQQQALADVLDNNNQQTWNQEESMARK